MKGLLCSPITRRDTIVPSGAIVARPLPFLEVTLRIGGGVPNAGSALFHY